MTGVTSGPQIAQLTSEVHDPTNGACLNLYYHMTGLDTGTLNIYVQKADVPVSDLITSDLVWTQNGDKGDVWLKAVVSVVYQYDWR